MTQPLLLFSLFSLLAEIKKIILFYVFYYFSLIFPFFSNFRLFSLSLSSRELNFATFLSSLDQFRALCTVRTRSLSAGFGTGII